MHKLCVVLGLAAVLLGGCSTRVGVTTWEVTPPEQPGGYPTVKVSDGKEGYVHVKYEKRKDGTVTVEYTGRRKAAAIIQARMRAQEVLSKHIAQDAIPAVTDALMRGLAPWIAP